jgi:hypothetical protein
MRSVLAHSDRVHPSFDRRSPKRLDVLRSQLLDPGYDLLNEVISIEVFVSKR